MFDEDRAKQVAIALAFALILAGSCGSGCVVVPVDYYAHTAPRNVGVRTETEIERGISKEEVILRFGEPDFASEDGCRLGYGWTKVKALVFWASNAGGGAAEVKRSYILEISFDENQRLSNARVIKSWGEGVPPREELKREE